MQVLLTTARHAMPLLPPTSSAHLRHHPFPRTRFGRVVSRGRCRDGGGENGGKLEAHPRLLWPGRLLLKVLKVLMKLFFVQLLLELLVKLSFLLLEELFGVRVQE